MDCLDITPLKDLRAYGSLGTSIHFAAPQSVDDIVSTVYHLVHNRYELLQDDYPAYVLGNINHLTFNIDHCANLPVLKERLQQLELSFGGSVSLSSILNANQDVEVMVSESGVFSKHLHHHLAMAIAPFKASMNEMDVVKQGQPEPVTEWTGALDLNHREDPMFKYIIAYSTDAESYPVIVFKLGTKTDDGEIGHLMAKVPIRTVVRIRLATLNKGWKPGCSTADIDNSTASVWVYNKVKRQGERVQGPEVLSKPGGHIPLWASDFLSVEDVNLPEEYQRPYMAQEAFKHPNIAISYSAISKAIQRVAAAQRTQPVAKYTDDPKFALLPRRFQASKGGVRDFCTMTRTAFPGDASRRYLKPMQPTTPLGLPTLGRALPRHAGRAALMERSMGTLYRLFRR